MRSVNSARERLKPVVLMLATLFAITSRFCSWALMPVAAIASALISTSSASTPNPRPPRRFTFWILIRSSSARSLDRRRPPCRGSREQSGANAAPPSPTRPPSLAPLRLRRPEWRPPRRFAACRSQNRSSARAPDRSSAPRSAWPWIAGCEYPRSDPQSRSRKRLRSSFDPRDVRHSRVLHEADGSVQHVSRLLRDLKIGLIAAVRLAHVGQFDQHVDVRHLNHTVFVRRRIARVALELERRRIEADRLH